jgi:hypothetical protein
MRAVNINAHGKWQMANGKLRLSSARVLRSTKVLSLLQRPISIEVTVPKSKEPDSRSNESSSFIMVSGLIAIKA